MSRLIFREWGSRMKHLIIIYIAIACFTFWGKALAGADSLGKSFSVSFITNYGGNTTLTVFISSKQNAKGSVEVPGLAFVEKFEVQANTVAEIEIPVEAQSSLNPVSQYAIQIVADNEVSVYGLNQRQYSTDAFLGLPTDVLGIEYLAMGYRSLGGLKSQLQVVGVYDQTEVSITATVDTDKASAHTPVSITLNRGDVYRLSAAGESITGSEVKSSKPVSVLSGSECAYVPYNRPACDHLVEMMPPVSTWGQSFLTFPLATRLKGDIFKVLASQDGTTVRINGVLVATLSRGENHEQVLALGSLIEANYPVLVAQYSTGQAFDGVISDPFMMLVPPAEQFLDHYAFTILGENVGFENGYVNVITPTESINSLILDGEAVERALFHPIGSSGFSGAQLQLLPGSHVVSSALPFGISAYGFGSYESYGYPGGMAFERINRAGDSYLPNVRLQSVGDVIHAFAGDSEDVNLDGILDQSEDLNGDNQVNPRSEDINGNGKLDDGEDSNGDGILDRDTGIFSIELSADSQNLALDLSDFVPGAVRVEFGIKREDSTLTGTGTLIVSDGVGNRREEIISLASDQTMMNVRVISTVNTQDIDLDNSSFEREPDKIETSVSTTLLEWQFASFSIAEAVSLDYQVAVKNAVAGTHRQVTQSLELFYTDINGKSHYKQLGQQQVSILNSVFNIGVSSPRQIYLANEQVPVSVQIKNLSIFSAATSARVSVIDEQGNLIQHLADIPVLELEGGQLADLPEYIFATGTLAAGSYQLLAELLDSQGQFVDSVKAPLIISGESDLNFQGVLSTEKPAYQAWDNVVINARTLNASLNQHWPAAIISIEVSDPSGLDLFSEIQTVNRLSSGAIRDFQFTLPLEDAPAGNFTVKLQVRDQSSNELQVSAVTQFSVARGALHALAGATSVNASAVAQGTEISCEHKLLNRSRSQDLSVQLEYLLLDVASKQQLARQVKTVSLPAEQNWIESVVYDTSPLKHGGYACALRVTAGNDSSQLGFAGFSVENPIKFSTALSLGSKPRLLVLVDSLPSDLNSELYSSEQAEREALQQTLDSADWFYSFVDNEADFIREMNEGGYGIYALLAERVTLKTNVQTDLNQRVEDGDGLLLAQGSEFLYPELQSSLGVKVHDYDLAANQLELLQGSVFNSAGNIDFYSEQSLLNFTLGFNGEKPAELVARFSDVNTSGALGKSPFGVGGAYNALVFGDFTAPSSTVEGRLGIAGNLDIDGYSIGDKLDSTMLNDTLVVGGDVNFPTGRVYSGNLLAGGSVAGVGSNVFDGMELGTSIQGNLAKQLPIGFEQSRDYLTNLSTSLSMLTANGETKVEWGGYTLTGDSVSTVQIFDVDADTLATVHSFIVKGIPVDATVIFNIHGGDSAAGVDVSNISFEDMKDHSFTTIYNFPQATSIHFNGVKMRGSVLAPLADINLPNGDIFGQLIAARWNGVMSISLFGFRGDIGDALTLMQLENAAAFNQVGLGQAMFNGFDLARNLTTNPNAFGDWLLQSLDAVAPSVSLTAGKVVPIKLTIFNEKAATQGKAEITLPVEVALIKSEFLLEGDHWRYDFDLLEAEAVTTEFYMRLPYSAVNSEVSLELFSGLAPNLLPQGNHQWPLVVEPPLQPSVQPVP